MSTAIVTQLKQVLNAFRSSGIIPTRICPRPGIITEGGFPVYTCACWADHAAADQRARYSTADWYRYAGHEATP